MKTIDLNELNDWTDEEPVPALVEITPGAPQRGTLSPPPPVLSFLDQIANLSLDNNHTDVLDGSQGAVVPLKETDDASLQNVCLVVESEMIKKASEHGSEAD